MTIVRGALDTSTDFVPSAAARQAEARAYGDLVRLFGRRVPQPPRGDLSPVVFVPGFISGDVSLTALARTLRQAGHRTFRSEIGANLGCTDDMVRRLLARIEPLVNSEGRPVALVGHSRGGMVVKLAAIRRPDLVAGVVTLSAPLTGELVVAAHVRKQLQLLFRLNDRGFARIISSDCVVGECAARIAAELDEPFPTTIPFTSVYTKSDAIIDWRSCLDPAADCIEVLDGTHTGMGTNPRVAEIVTERLGRLAPTY